MLLTGLAPELYWEDPAGEAKAALDEAIEIARRIGDEPRPRRGAEPAPVRPHRRRGASASRWPTELLEMAERAGADEMVVRSHAYRLNDMLELGDIAGVDRELEVYTRLAEKLRQPQHLWHIPLLRGMRATMDGRFDEAERAGRGGARRRPARRGAAVEPVLRDPDVRPAHAARDASTR